MGGIDLMEKTTKKERLLSFIKKNKPEMLYLSAGFFITLGVMMIFVPAGFIALGSYIFIALLFALKG
jgi:hypothetical protein